jgi:anti-sigma regulatory factor (Ser/Thr protein kinase)
MRVTIQLEPEHGNLRHVRRIAQTWMDAVGATWDALPLVTTELVSNALAASPPDRPVEVHLEASGAELAVSVLDAGSGLKSRHFSPPPATSVRGRGLAIVDSLADRLTIDRQDGCTRVTARKLATS